MKNFKKPTAEEAVQIAQIIGGAAIITGMLIGSLKKEEKKEENIPKENKPNINNAKNSQTIIINNIPPNFSKINEIEKIIQQNIKKTDPKKMYIRINENYISSSSSNNVIMNGSNIRNIKTNNIFQNNDTKTEQQYKAPQKSAVDNNSEYKQGIFLTETEKKFFRELKNACKDLPVNIFAKSRLEDIINAKKGSNEWSNRGKIKSRHVDFTICDDFKLEPFLVIELDDYTHDTKKAKDVDDFKDTILREIGIPIIRVRVKNNYSNDLTNIVNTIKRKMS